VTLSREGCRARRGPDRSYCADNQVGYDAGKQVKGRKIHALVDSEGLPMRVVIHSVAIQDRDRVGLVLNKKRRRFPWLELIWADGDYNAWHSCSCGGKGAAAAPGDRQAERRHEGLSSFCRALSGRAHLLLLRTQPASRPAPGTTRASMTGARSDLRQATSVEEVRLGAGKSARLPPRRSRPAAFDRLPWARCAIYCCRNAPKMAILAANRSESGECRYTAPWQPAAAAGLAKLRIL
jgi:hypothetical protein